MDETLKYSQKARYPMVEQCSKAYDITVVIKINMGGGGLGYFEHTTLGYHSL